MPTKNFFLGLFIATFWVLSPPSPLLEHKILPPPGTKIRITPPVDLFSTPLLSMSLVPPSCHPPPCPSMSAPPLLFSTTFPCLASTHLFPERVWRGNETLMARAWHAPGFTAIGRGKKKEKKLIYSEYPWFGKAKVSLFLSRKIYSVAFNPSL